MNVRSLLPATVVALLVCAQPTAVHAQSAGAEPPFRYYSTIDGLSQSDVYDIEQDGAGFLWFTTARGLNRFDGKDFNQYTIADGLPSNALTALYIDRENAVWVGDAAGAVTVLIGGQVKFVVQPIGKKNMPITDIVVFEGRAIVVAAGAGLLEIVESADGPRFQALAGADVGAIKLTTHDSEIWVEAETGLYRLVHRDEPSLELIDASVRITHVARDGTLWMINNRNEVGIWQDGRFVSRSRFDGGEPLNSIASASDGTVWVSTRSELYGFDAAAAVAAKELEVRKYDVVDEISSLFVDRENTLWLASESRLVRFLGDRFRHYKLTTGTDATTVWTISEDRAGRLWFGTQSKVIVRDEQGELSNVTELGGLPSGQVRDIVRGQADDMWAGIRGHGVFRINSKTLEWALVPGTEQIEVLDVSVSDRGIVWFSSLQSGIGRYDPASGSLRRIATPDNTSVYTLDLMGEDDVWYGADEVGLVHLTIDPGGDVEQRTYGADLGLSNTLFDHVRIFDDKTVWIAMDEGGLYRFESGLFINHGAATPLADQTVYLVEVLDNGTLVVGGEQGLYQFSPGSNEIARYNHLGGFLGVETNVHAVFLDSDDRLWIGTVDGVTAMAASYPMPEYVELTPQLLSMATEAGQIPIEHGAEIDPTDNSLQVEFAAVSLLHPRGIEYSYKLSGIDSGWGNATSNRSVRFSNIPPGTYDFMVRARYAGGVWSDRYASRQFTVLPFFWQKPWFILAALVVLVATLRTSMAYRTRKLDKLNEQLRAQVLDRTKSIERARFRLQVSNDQLLREVEERRRADSARAELETRFRRAFENAPIGMGLMDAECILFDANPALQKMYWNNDELPEKIDFVEAIAEQDRDEFRAAYESLARGESDSQHLTLDCHTSSGELLHAVVNLSAVKSGDDEFLYSVLQVQDITESFRLTQQLEQQASYDELTGLLNRRSFESELMRACANSDSSKNLNYLMYMDLDQFKVVNDTSGHAAGDELLRQISELILDNVRGDDTVCRLGGDEFGLILWNCPADVARRIAESIRVAIDTLRFQWESETYRVGISIGGLPIEPGIADVSELQQLADAACYAAKEAGRNRVHMVSGDKDSARVHRGQVRWVQRLREAMDQNRFAIYGQTIQSLDENPSEPENLEILLRLRDPASRKLIPPGAFLPAAERYGLSVELDQWVVTNLLHTLYVYNSFQAAPCQYWINLSGTSIGDKRFAHFLVRAMNSSPLPPGTINFEITETAVIRSVVEAGNLMHELREMGCRFALDDFGSGLSSFGYLKKLPVDFLKIDGMFIREIVHDKTDRIFVKSIIDIAHTLGIKTIAEFIEDGDMLDVVRNLGADYVQGFAIGRPFALAPRLPLDAIVGKSSSQTHSNAS